jgi:hypothetical protein
LKARDEQFAPVLRRNTVQLPSTTHEAHLKVAKRL